VSTGPDIGHMLSMIKKQMSDR